MCYSKYILVAILSSVKKTVYDKNNTTLEKGLGHNHNYRYCGHIYLPIYK